MLTLDEIKLNRLKIESLLKAVNRNGMDSVLCYLANIGFYEVPSSIYRHHNWRGGLAQHCLGVFIKAFELNKNLPIDSLIIAGLLHDVCKAGKFYYDGNGFLQHRQTHIKGHGRRSVMILEKCGLVIKPEEYRAIRWHMGGHYVKTEEEMCEVKLARSEPLWQAIHMADHINAKEND